MRLIVTIVCVIGLLASCACAWAAVSGPLTITATSGTKVATWSYNWIAGQTAYDLTAPVYLRAPDNTLLGTVTKLSCEMPNDPAIFLDFAVHAVVDANFTFDSGEMFFSTIGVPSAFATAATTLTADGSTATFTGNFAGGHGYEATYNGGTLFANLDETFTSPATMSTVETRREPLAGTTIIGVPVSSMRAQWDFDLTANDDASGTSRFEIDAVPDASTLVLAFAGVAPLVGCLVRRRRIV
jgi:hypothetical protein